MTGDLRNFRKQWEQANYRRTELSQTPDSEAESDAQLDLQMNAIRMMATVRAEGPDDVLLKLQTWKDERLPANGFIDMAYPEDLLVVSAIADLKRLQAEIHSYPSKAAG